METEKYPKHLERHKAVYERHQNGETYISLAAEMGITPVRVRQLAQRWIHHLWWMEVYDRQMVKKDGQPT
jgi:hypothetical protein